MTKRLRGILTQALMLSTSLLIPQLSNAQTPAPLIKATQEATTTPPVNGGSVATTFTKSANIPASTTNAAPNASAGETALDFGTTTGNYFVQSTAPVDGLKNLTAFTLTGWLNAKSLTTGAGGNRIISWINNGGDGVDLVLQNNGSLRLGVDGWPDNSPAFSSASKVTANATAPLQNWVFFAVTYQSNGQVRFYFGNNANNATLDVSRTYTAPGVTGSNIGKLAIGAFNDNTRNAATWDRMFRGVIDDIRIYGSALSVTDIVNVQRSNPDTTPPTAPTNLRTTLVNATTIALAWDAGTDNVGIAGYDIYDQQVLMASVGNVTSHTLAQLQAGRTYSLRIRSKDAAGNFSPYTSYLDVQTVDPTPNPPLLYMPLNDIAGGTPTNIGSAQGAVFNTGTGQSGTSVPGLSLESPPYVGGFGSADFGGNPGNAFIESQAPINQLKNMSAFTITGWVNAKSNATGAGGNRIVSWINNGGDGVDLVYRSNGSLQLGVDAWPDESPAFSSPNKVTANANAPQSNWVFFAVTYQSNGQVQYYFGTNTAKATLDVTRTYTAPGVTGSNIGKLAIGAFNSATRNASTYDRMFRGLIDDIRVFDSALPLSYIISVQGKDSPDVTPPPAPTSLTATSKTISSISLSWQGTDDVFSYNVYNNGNIIAHAPVMGSTATYVLTNLTANTTYNLTVKAEDAAGNLSAASSAISVTTDATGVPLPLIDAKFEGDAGGSFMNEGTISTVFTRGIMPTASTNVPNGPNNFRSADFGTTPNDYYIENYPWGPDELKGMTSFTLTGWLNNKSSTMGAGGNRVITWTNNGGDGVDLVYQNDGSLRLGVDQLAGNSPAVSSIGKVTTAASAGTSNWIFFAVTYQSNGQVQFYFGNNGTDATLDVTRNYPGRGPVGTNIGKLAFGSFNDELRAGTGIENMFRGLIDNFKIYGSVLSLADIRKAQRGVSSDATPPTAPTNLALVSDDGTYVNLSWTASTDNVGVVDYNLYSGNTFIKNTGGATDGISVTGLTQRQTYSFNVKARDAAGNLSAASNTLTVTAKKLPLIDINFDAYYGIPVFSGGTFNTSIFANEINGPCVSPNSPNGSGAFSLNALAGASTISEGLKGLSAFTIAGWVNRTSIGTTDRIMGWMADGGGDGVELLIQNDGSLRLGVDGLAGNSPALSSINMITTNPAAAQENWVFFAVTYSSDGQTRFYFGSDALDATLDATVNYAGPGITGSNISTFYIRPPRGGLIDAIRAYSSVLTLQEVIALQHGTPDDIPPTSMGILSLTNVTETSASLHWTDQGTDNIGITSYDVFNGATLVKRHVPLPKYAPYYNDAYLNDLTPGTTYNFTVRARDSQGNYSTPTNVVQVTTPGGSPSPLVWLKLDEPSNVTPINNGSSTGSYVKSVDRPAGSGNVPSEIVGVRSADFGNSNGNAFIESQAPVNELKSLSSFTITGWVNCRSGITGQGGNRIVSWINNGGDGVDLVYENDGRLRLGVNMWPDESPAASSGKVSAIRDAPTENWVFFAVTYTQNGNVQFYFGRNNETATLHLTVNYPGRGAVGSNIGKLAIGNFNDATRNNLPAFDRVFRGLIDDIRIFGNVLTPQQITDVQGRSTNSSARIASSPEPIIQDEVIDEAILSQNYPNPFSSGTNIEANIPHSVKVARITVVDVTGRSMQNIEVEGRGPVSVAVSSDRMNSGVYIYTLITDGKIVGYKRMMISK